MSIPILGGARDVPAETNETPFCEGDDGGAKGRVDTREGEDWICKDILNMAGWGRRLYILYLIFYFFPVSVCVKSVLSSFYLFCSRE
jgi:hypothetical protein